MYLDAIVVGAGQAGLAAGYWLAQRGKRFVILHADARVGDVWRRRWPSLSLITPAGKSSLSGLPFEGPPDHLPTRNEVADYLERYAQRFELPVHHGVRVTRARCAGDGFEVESSTGTLRARTLVAATGVFTKDRVPAWSQGLSSEIVQLTASRYQSPADLPDGPVLVVGAGNSGSQIALELAPTRRVYLAGPSPGWLPRRVLGRDVYHWVWPVLRTRTTGIVGRVLAGVWSKGGHPRIGLRERDLRAADIVRLPKVHAVAQVPDVRSVVWCLGFDPDHSWIEMPHNTPGLVFLGVPYSRRLNSGLMGGVGEDAREVLTAL